jgi:TRAP-type C4-dicarboxylate transport system permease large subunit
VRVLRSSSPSSSTAITSGATCRTCPPRGEDGGDGDDADRLLGRLRLHDGPDADPGEGDAFFLTISENKYVFLFLVNILLLLLGTFMDLAPMLLICTPIFLPVIAKLGIDPVHFGMIMILNLGIGLITPPVGPTLFVGCAIGKVTIEQVSKELWPFYGAMCIALLLVTYIPAISLWLPGLMK